MHGPTNIKRTEMFLTVLNYFQLWLQFLRREILILFFVKRLLEYPMYIEWSNPHIRLTYLQISRAPYFQALPIYGSL
jgi:hypothetical protein